MQLHEGPTFLKSLTNMWLQVLIFLKSNNGGVSRKDMLSTIVGTIVETKWRLVRDHYKLRVLKA